MTSFAFYIEVQWAGLDFLVGQFWPPGLMFVTPASRRSYKHIFIIQQINILVVIISRVFSAILNYSCVTLTTAHLARACQTANRVKA